MNFSRRSRVGGDKESPCKAWLVAMRMPTVAQQCQVRHYLRPNVCVP